MNKLDKSKRVKLNIAIIIIGIFSVGLVYSILNIVDWKHAVNKNNKIQEETKEKVRKKDGKYNIDFESLKKQNSDTIAYIKVENTNIDYVVVKSYDNRYYLNRNFNKEYNVAGWIFADYNNKFNGNDDNIVIYGHNTVEGSMFGTLKDTLESEWQSKKNDIVLVTEQGEYKYQVFSTYKVDPEDYYIKTKFYDDDKYIKFLDTLKSRSNHDFNVKLKRNDKILTLSSCTEDGSQRVVLHAKLVSIDE